MPPKLWIEERDGDVILRLRVQPRASSNVLRRDDSGVVRVSLTSAPVDGAANKALLAFLAKRLGISGSSMSVKGGIRSRNKTLRIVNMTIQDVEKKLFGTD